MLSGSMRSPQPACSPITRGLAVASSPARRKATGVSMLTRIAAAITPLWRRRLRRVHDVEARPGDRLDVRLEVRCVEGVHAHDDGLAVSGLETPQEPRELLARLRLHRFIDRVLEVERQGVGFARERFREE